MLGSSPSHDRAALGGRPDSAEPQLLYCAAGCSREMMPVLIGSNQDLGGAYS